MRSTTHLNSLDYFILQKCTLYSFLCNNRQICNGVVGHVWLLLTKGILVFWLSVSVVAQNVVFIELQRVNVLKGPWAPPTIA